ncbi:phytanoyl-CoA dioxygenase family protein [Novosphingobium cyanobacteriorum]|uniref:Phytanoyl-CoA dioxygenase family protein n=1 Tax=Novosphingobium cyanobacteriorum TaxID=3024215 RepID=A0ABT6CID6_9SPHN|nr:phytanoyl-CoA dioxygenase family protein [Novosphingobium cyanobacteriorum]MDF8333688.1 phytanoyl-CoA dioxygenase family protein [Novosphingobium cyanobacteriorum]
MVCHPSSVSLHVETLLARGYLVLEDALAPAVLGAVHADLWDDFERTPFGKGQFYGDATKRFGRLPLRSRAVHDLILHAHVLAIVEAVLGPSCDTVQLNTTQAISVHPGQGQQLPHRDQDMWRLEPGSRECLVNVMWPLTPFTARNGGTVIWPESHSSKAASHSALPAPIVPDLMPGAALMFLGSTLHGAGANCSRAERRGVLIGYALGWLKPYENPWLAYPPELARTFPPALAALAGYVQHRPNLGNFEGQCPSVLLRGYAGEPLGAVDALREDQESAAATWLAQGQVP